MIDIEEALQLSKQLDDPKVYYKNGALHGVMGSVLTHNSRTVYSVSVDNRFTTAMLRDVARYIKEPFRTLCFVTDQESEFNRLKSFLEDRHGFISVIIDDAFNGLPLMYSFYFKNKGL